MAELSIADQVRMSNLELKSTLMQNMFDTSSSISAIQKAVNSKNNMVYAEEGDSKYKEEIDTDSDGKITYNEYVKYISQQNLKKYEIPTNQTTFKSLYDNELGFKKTQILSMGKALAAYMKNSALLPQGIISREA